MTSNLHSSSPNERERTTEKQKTMASAPTGCFKCGRPGHWSRDCPSSSAPIPNSTSALLDSSKSSSLGRNVSGGGGGGSSRPLEKPKKLPRTRPKLTPELLVSDDGLGYVLRHFPRAFKYRGPGHEVSDLGNLIGLYSEWHSSLLPYFSFHQFVQKVEQVGSTKRLKRCLRELREKVENGVDPTKLHEPVIHDDLNENQGNDQTDYSLRNDDADVLQENLLQEIYQKVTEEPLQNVEKDIVAVEGDFKNKGEEGSANQSKNVTEITLTEEQRARMEASRVKALERAAARIRPLQAA